MSTPSITLTILGSGTAVPWRHRNPPGLVVRVESEEGRYLALVDPSAGSSQRMVERGYPFEDLTHVLFSHFHPDHCGDLAPILFALKNPRFGGVGRATPLRLVGPPGLQRFSRSLERAYGRWIQHETRVRVQEVDWRRHQGFFALGPLEVTCYPVDHADPSVAYRFELRGGAVVAYSGDTDRCDGIVAAASGADLLVIECAFPEGEKRRGHLVPSEVGRIAAAANVRRVVLTHLYPECWGKDLIGPCREHYSGDVEIAEDGFTVHL